MTWLRAPGPGIPLPSPTPRSAPFWTGCARAELLFQRCTNCGDAIFDPALVCPRCDGDVLAWQPSRGRGFIYSWSIVWRPQSPAFGVPYAPIIVRLDEGFDMVSCLIDCDHEDVRVDLAVEVAFGEPQDGVRLPYFRPAPDEHVSARRSAPSR